MKIWLVYYKKDSGQPRVLMKMQWKRHAVLHGWIDGKIKKIDRSLLLSPRDSCRVRPRSSWNKANIQRAERLIAERKMMPAGLAAFNSKHRRETPVLPSEMPSEGAGSQIPKAVHCVEELREFSALLSEDDLPAGWPAPRKKRPGSDGSRS